MTSRDPEPDDADPGGTDRYEVDSQFRTCPFSPLGPFESANLIGWQRKLFGDELLPLVDLCDRLRDAGFGGTSLYVRVALVASGPVPLAITIDPTAKFSMLHEVERTIETTFPEDMAWVVLDRLAFGPPKPGEPS